LRALQGHSVVSFQRPQSAGLALRALQE